MNTQQRPKTFWRIALVDREQNNKRLDSLVARRDFFVHAIEIPELQRAEREEHRLLDK